MERRPNSRRWRPGQELRLNIYHITIPGGSDTYVQYNNGGVFGGDSTMTFDDATKTLTAQELSVTNDADVGATCTVKRLLAGGVTE